MPERDGYIAGVPCWVDTSQPDPDAALPDVDDVDRHFEHAKQFGARIVKPLTNMPFGERLYTTEDHAGHRWTFSQHVADVAPEAWGATPAPPR